MSNFKTNIKLKDIISNDIKLLIPEDKLETEVTGISANSKKTKKGYIFVAIKGEKSDGFDYIQNAIENGSILIICQTNHPYEQAIEKYKNIIFIPVPFPRYHLSIILSKFNLPLPDNIIAVTGTNGKTSVVEFSRQILDKLNIKSASVGTLGINTKDTNKKMDHTTGDPEILYQELSSLKSNGFDHIILEASSHGLDQQRLHGLNLKAGAFTNLTQDHLDYHETIAAYGQAKEILFDDLIIENGLAVINLDDDYCDNILNAAKRSNLNILTFGKNKKADIRIIKSNANSKGQEVTLLYNNNEINLNLHLCGEFQLYNVLTAVGLVSSIVNNSIDDLLKCIENLHPVRGRMEHVTDYNQGSIYIDYAHTPDALKNILHVLREHIENGSKLITIFGCGGDRDKAKRSQMGKIADELSDKVIITNDNPRSEDPVKISMDIASGINDKNKTEVILDRKEAIDKSIKKLSKGDILLVAGKGHEQGQIIGGKIVPFCDRNIIVQYCNMLGS